jgi:hypothetical protein
LTNGQTADFTLSNLPSGWYFSQLYDVGATSNQISTLFRVTAPSQSNVIYCAGSLVTNQANSFAVGTYPGTDPGKIRIVNWTSLSGGNSLTLNLYSMSHP